MKWSVRLRRYSAVNLAGDLVNCFFPNFLLQLEVPLGERPSQNGVGFKYCVVQLLFSGFCRAFLCELICLFAFVEGLQFWRKTELPPDLDHFSFRVISWRGLGLSFLVFRGARCLAPLTETAYDFISRRKPKKCETER